jgi:Big-like domain-containing protein
MKRWFVGMTALGLACGGDSSGPGAASVTGIAGDNQSAATGAVLPVPLSFTALGSDGLPIEGVSVSWSVTPAGGASFSPATSQTNANGVAATTVSMGATPGQITIHATVAGIAQPVEYHATILDPCLSSIAYTLGDTVSGVLARTDCKLNGFFYDFYSLTLPAGQHSIRISMNASTFDPYLELFNTSGFKVGEDDDIVQGTNQNSRLDIILGEGGTYDIGANSFDTNTVGAYTVSVINRPTTLGSCQDAWITPGVTIVDTVRTSDCTVGGALFDAVWLWAASGTVLQFAERSTLMDPLIKLYRANFQTRTLDSVAANNDSSAGNQNAYITHTVPILTAPCCLYQLRLGTAIVGDTGEYTLVFSPVTAAASMTLPHMLTRPTRTSAETPRRKGFQD